MAELKTKINEESVKKFLENIEDDKKRADSYVILNLMKEVTGEEPKMWGKSIVGFGTYHYKYKSGREGDWFKAGFSPRKSALTLYIMSGFEDYEDLMAELGKYKTGKSCLYIKKIEDIDLKVLEKLVEKSLKHLDRLYG